MDTRTADEDVCRCLAPGLFVVARGPAPVQQAVEQILGAFPAVTMDSPPPHDRCLLLAAEQVDGSNWRISVNNLPLTTLASHRQMAPFFETLITSFAIQRHEEYAAFHASCVAYQGRGILFPGEKGAGKSTLSLYLAQNGFDYLSDEVAWVRAEDRHLVPFPKAAAIKAGSFHLFETTSEYASVTRGPLRYYWPPSLALGAVPASLLLFPVFREEGQTEIYALRPEETALQLANYCFGGIARHPDWLPVLSSLSACPAYLTVYQNAEDIRQFILETLAERSS